MNYARPNLTKVRYRKLMRIAKMLGYKRWSSLLDRWMDYTVKNPDLFRKNP